MDTSPTKTITGSGIFDDIMEAEERESNHKYFVKSSLSIQCYNINACNPQHRHLTNLVVYQKGVGLITTVSVFLIVYGPCMYVLFALPRAFDPSTPQDSPL